MNVYDALEIADNGNAQKNIIRAILHVLSPESLNAVNAELAQLQEARSAQHAEIIYGLASIFLCVAALICLFEWARKK